MDHKLGKNQVLPIPGHFLWKSGLLVLGFLIFRLIFAGIVPFANDEAYYWDWGRDLQLSYFDHPPGVSWLAKTGSFLADGLLGARILVPFIHALTSILLAYITWQSTASPLRAFSTIVMSQVLPIVSLGGMMLMPDIGLLFFSTVALWIATIICQRSTDQHLKIKYGILLGLAFGGAGLFKYHALLLCGGMSFSIIMLRRKSLREDLPFWLAVLLTGFVTCLPVWIWNAQNQWASLLFQSGRSAGPLEFKPQFFLQIVVASMIFLSPYALWRIIAALLALFARSLGKKPINNPISPFEALALGTSLPLLTLILLLSFSKQMLPHWIVPALWFAIPLATNTPPRFSRLWQANIIGATLLALLIPVILGVPQIREQLIATTRGNPGGLGEMTVWQPLVNDDRLKSLTEKAVSKATHDPPHCPKPFAWGSLRWYSTAQLAFALPEHPKVFSTESNRYYYHYRDRNQNLAGCTVLVIGERGHFNANSIENHFDLLEHGELLASGHNDRPFIWFIGRALPLMDFDP